MTSGLVAQPVARRRVETVRGRHGRSIAELLQAARRVIVVEVVIVGWRLLLYNNNSFTFFRTHYTLSILINYCVFLIFK